MKNMSKCILNFCLLWFMLFSASCKKNAVVAPVVMAPFYLDLHTFVNTTEIDTTHPVALDSAGRKIKLTTAQFYVSAIRLMQPTGFYYDLPGGVILKTIGTNSFYIGNVPVGTYNYVSFNVGLGDPDNSTDPSTYPAGSILAPQVPSMWFGSTVQGYVFMNIQGLADTTAAHNGPLNYPISYETGRPSELYGVNMPYQPFTVAAGQNNFIHIACDYGKLLQPLNFKTQNNVTPFNNPNLASQIASNARYMFHYQ